MVATQIERSDPDLIYVWNGSNLTAAATIAAVRSGRPVAMRICEYWLDQLVEHDAFGRFLKSDLRGAEALWGLVARLVNRSDNLGIPGSQRFPIAISWVSEFLRRSTTVTAPFEVVHSDVTYPALSHGERLATVPRTPTPGISIALVGRVVPEKGVDVAIRALAILRDRHGIVAQLQVAGPGDPDYISSLRAEADTLRVGPQVQFLGSLQSEDVATLLAGAQIALVPSTWNEPAGLTALEAAAARVPVVASRSGGIPELLAEDTQALFFEIGESDECAAQLATTLEHPDAADRRARDAFARARSLGFERYLARTDRFLDDAMLALRP